MGVGGGEEEASVPTEWVGDTSGVGEEPPGSIEEEVSLQPVDGINEVTQRAVEVGGAEAAKG